MNITKTDSTNFRATMNISQVKNYRHYWNEVAKNFGKKTANTEATMTVLNPSGVIGFGITYLNNQKESMVYVSCSKDCFDKMTNESPANTADKLTKVLDFATEANAKKGDIISKFKEKVQKIGLKATQVKKWHTLYAKEVNAKKDKVMQSINKDINNSNDLKGFEILI